MTSKSFSSKGLLGNSMRRNLWALVLSGVGFFLSLLLPVLMQVQNALEMRAIWIKERPQAEVASNWSSAMSSVSELLGGINPLPKMVFLVLAVVCGVALFAYLHNRQKVDFYHSLPISRTRLFANNFLTGIVCTFSTYFVMLAITLACTFAMGCGEAVHWDEIGGAVLCNLIIFLLVYALTVLTTVFCGHTVITLLLLVWVFFSPMLIRILQIGLFTNFYETYTSADAYYNLGLAAFLSPVFQYFGIDGLHFRGSSFVFGGTDGSSALGLLVGYLIAAAVVTALALFLFRIRRSERAGTALAFTPTKLPIKVYMCLVIGATFGWLFGVMAGNFWFWPGLVIGTVLFHWIVEIIYAFDFRAIFAKPLHLLAILVVLFAGMLAMQFDVTGYDTWLPDREDITAVDINVVTTPQLTDPSNIDAVYRLMEIGVQYVEGEAPQAEFYRGVTVACQLGGRTVRRYYTVPETDEVNALLAQIEQSEEYKRAKWPLFRFDEASTDPNRRPLIDVRAHTAGGMTSVELSNPEKLVQVVTTLREESLSRTGSSKPVMFLSLYYLDEEGNYNYDGEAYVTEADTKTLALLEEQTGLTPVPYSVDEVLSIQIEYGVKVELDATEWQTVQVTDRADMQALLTDGIDETMVDYRSDSQYANREDYTVVITAQLRDDTMVMLAYLAEDWPSEIVDKYRPDGVSDSTPESGIASTAEAVS
ncbi:hypothetical protein [Agathobaculum sp.]|uniref:hypothetical protein n=1 Tax=Agathobaculum sp. TaxID=2048138 RepID=UPI0027B97D9C|nr:hypothetical protein [Agathobaculum sp.]